MSNGSQDVDDISLKAIGEKWFVLLRLLLIIFIVYILFNFLNPNTRHEFTVTSIVSDNAYFAVSDENKAAFFTDKQATGKMEIGSLIWVYYKKGTEDIVKVKKQ